MELDCILVCHVILNYIICYDNYIMSFHFVFYIALCYYICAFSHCMRRVWGRPGSPMRGETRTLRLFGGRLGLPRVSHARSNPHSPLVWGALGVAQFSHVRSNPYSPILYYIISYHCI